MRTCIAVECASVAPGGCGGGEADEEPLALGELAQLTVSNEPEAYDVAGGSKESFRKTWNAKYTLRSHFDGVTTLIFLFLCLYEVSQTTAQNKYMVLRTEESLL